MDAAYRNAMAQRDQLAAEINEVQQRLEELRRKLAVVDNFLRQWVEFAGKAPSMPPVESGDRSLVGMHTPKPRPKNPPKEVVIESVLSILRERGEPMSRAELFAALGERGIVLEGSDPQMVLSTMLWRMREKVTRLPKNMGYWPADVPYEPAGYVPIEQLRTEHTELVSAIAAADEAYFKDDSPIIDDARYDAMRRRLAEIEENFPDLVTN